jgi:tRNA A37 threonylcarbamoyladenosine dehydratase
VTDFSRHEKLVGEAGVRRLSNAHVVVFGIGGVGGYAAEALARAAVGAISLVDSDTVTQSNINRQIVALRSTMGFPKVQVMRARIHDIHPECDVTIRQVFADKSNIEDLLMGATYAVDAVDTVSAKLAIVAACSDMDIPVISAMGAGNKLSGSFTVKDVFDTKEDPLARVMRRELRKRGIAKLKVVASDSPGMHELKGGEPIPSISYMPALCGLTIAGEVIRDIIGWQND